MDCKSHTHTHTHEYSEIFLRAIRADYDTIRAPRTRTIRTMIRFRFVSIFNFKIAFFLIVIVVVVVCCCCSALICFASDSAARCCVLPTKQVLTTTRAERIHSLSAAAVAVSCAVAASVSASVAVLHSYCVLWSTSLIRRCAAEL